MECNSIYMLMLSIIIMVFVPTVFSASLSLTSNNPFVDDVLILICRTDQQPQYGQVEFHKPGMIPAGGCYQGQCRSSLGYTVVQSGTNLTTILLVERVNRSTDEGIWKCKILGETAQTNVKFQVRTTPKPTTPKPVTAGPLTHKPTTPKRGGQTSGSASFQQLKYISTGLCWIALWLART